MENNRDYGENGDWRITCSTQRLYLFAQTSAVIRANNQVNEISGITVQLKIVSEATNVFTQILVFLACGGNSFVN
jgi:hypothetical protein